MSHQPTPGTWYAVLTKGDRPDDDIWIARTRRSEGTNGPDVAIGWRLAPVASGRMSNYKRNADEEQANALLFAAYFAASKEAIRALLAMIDGRTMTVQAFQVKWGQDFDPWEKCSEDHCQCEGAVNIPPFGLSGHFSRQVAVNVAVNQ